MNVMRLTLKVEKELQFMADYIELQKERLSPNIVVTCDDLKNIKGFSIAPFILMPLLENCFKHVSINANKESLINIQCKLADNWFYFETINTFGQSSRPNKTGIGLANVYKRLDLIYPGKHVLDIENCGEIFKLILKIDIK
jgi:two-component system LytT family sensor kinase